MNRFHTPQSICRFGIARGDITPPVGTYHRMWGAAAHDQSTGVHRPLTATALVFRPAGDGAGQQIVVALDHCLFFQPEIRRIKDAVCSALSVDRAELTLTFSHTHAAGLMDPARRDMPGGDRIEPYLDELAARIERITRDALAAIQPATILYGHGRCALAAHRDYWDAAHKMFVCGFNPAGDADDTLVVARVADGQNKTVATIVNYACHPTTLAWDNTLISPDYPGAMREVVEQATGAPCVFLQGASGDLGPRDGFVGDTAVADRNGRQLGHAALAVCESLPPPNTEFVYQGPVISGATIGTWRHAPIDEPTRRLLSEWQLIRATVDLPYLADLPKHQTLTEQFAHWQHEESLARSAGDAAQAADARAMAERMRRWMTRTASLPTGDHFPYPFFMWRIGDAIWLAVDGEPYNVLQRNLRERFPDRPIIVMVLCDGSKAWYLPTAETYGKGIYQESMAVLRRGSLEKLIDAIGNELDRLLIT